MTPEKQRIAIAEACGWTKCRLAINGAGAPERGKSPYGVPPRRGYEVSLPNYTQNLNAMHEAEKVLWDTGKAMEFTNQLVGIADDHLMCLSHATAGQRAEAFLRVLGLWEEAL